MNADAFRQLYDYHFTENRKIWDRYVTQLPPEQFRQDVAYSQGSVRNQLLHLMDVDDIWFSELQGIEPVEPPDPTLEDRGLIRTHGDKIEQKMRGYLAELRDDMLFTKPIEEPEEDQDLMVWQVLLHVVNHGTDHRAQILRQLNDMGVETAYQDFIFHVYEQLYAG